MHAKSFNQNKNRLKHDLIVLFLTDGIIRDINVPTDITKHFLHDYVLISESNVLPQITFQQSSKPRFCTTSAEARFKIPLAILLTYIKVSKPFIVLTVRSHAGTNWQRPGTVGYISAGPTGQLQRS